MTRMGRAIVTSRLRFVDEVIDFNDGDDTAIDAICRLLYPRDEIIFANGGDRTTANIPEMEVKNAIFKFGVGGTKQNSSSKILSDWANT